MQTPKTPVDIRTIEIRNFRNIEDLTLDFTGADDGPSEIVVIAGPNGCGKTAVLEACLLALGYEGRIQGSKSVNTVQSGMKYWEIDISLQRHDQILSVSQRCERINKLPVVKNKTDYIHMMYFSSGRTLKLIGPLSITSGGNGKPPEDIDENRVWRIKQHFINSKAHALMASPSPETEPDYARKLKLLNNNWALFHDGPGYEFVVEPCDANPDSGFDLFLKSSDGTKLSVDRLSFGQMELLGFFGGLLMVGFEEGVVIIDEPELHLDPQWHGLLMLAIQRLLPKVQLIVATHSTKIYDSVYSFQQFFLESVTLPRHECGNHMLDAPAVFGCGLQNRKRTKEDISAILSARAADQLCWLACKKVRQQLRQAFLTVFPDDPKPSQITDISSASDCILNSKWFGELPKVVSEWSNPKAVTDALAASLSTYQQHLANGSWIKKFSGKELFRAIRDFNYQPPRNTPQAQPSVHDLTFAKAIGRRQADNDQVPADLQHLHACLRYRVGLGSQPPVPS